MLGVGFSSGWADPSTGQVWPPPIDPATGAVIGSGMVSAQVVAAVPAVARAMGVITGRTTQMPLTLWQDGVQVASPRLLVQPDPVMDYPTLMSALWWDYMIHGNAILYDTVLHDVQPVASVWLPAERVSCWEHEGQTYYEMGGVVLDSDRVRHVRRRLDPWRPWRGIGVLEQHMRPFARISDQEAYQSRLLRDSAVPTVAVTSSNPDLSQDEAEKAKQSYMEKFGKPSREPIFLPYGSTIAPLGWSPKDAEISEMQKASRGDVADVFNLDRWYLGVNDGSFNYKTYSAMSLALVKDTLGEHMRTFEGVLTAGWCEPGQEIRLDPSGVIVDDEAATVAWLCPAVDAGIVTIDEARAKLGYPPLTDVQRAQLAQQRTTSPAVLAGLTTGDK